MRSDGTIEETKISPAVTKHPLLLGGISAHLLTVGGGFRVSFDRHPEPQNMCDVEVDHEMQLPHVCFWFLIFRIFHPWECRGLIPMTWLQRCSQSTFTTLHGESSAPFPATRGRVEAMPLGRSARWVVSQRICKSMTVGSHAHLLGFSIRNSGISIKWLSAGILCAISHFCCLVVDDVVLCSSMTMYVLTKF